MSCVLTLATDAASPVHRVDAVTGESPYWDKARGTLWWIDIHGHRLFGHRPASGQTSAHRLQSMPGFVLGRSDGNLVLGLEDGVHAFDPATGLAEMLAPVEANNPATRLNDGKADIIGRLWFGTMDKNAGHTAKGALYRLDADRTLHNMRRDVRIPNAIAFSPDNRTLYFADSRSRRVEAIAFDVDAGSLGASRTFVVYPEGEIPDGTCVDAEGGVWIAVVGGSRIERRLPDGRLDMVVRVPVSRPTMPMLGGPDGRTLFVTSQRRFLSSASLLAEPLAGELLAVRVPYSAGPSHAVRVRESRER
jgi:sugar lactone lactonase YvrE